MNLVPNLRSVQIHVNTRERFVATAYNVSSLCFNKAQYNYIISQGRVSTGSTLYSKDQNVTSPLPGGSQKLKTDMKFVDFIDDWKTTWLTMNSKTSNETNGRLDDQLIPKGRNSLELMMK